MPGLGRRIGLGRRAASQSWSSYWATLKEDGNTMAWYNPKIPSGVRKTIDGKESIYWDLMIGSSTYGAEQATGNIVLYAVYKITACEANYFYTGCQVGDVFPCGTVKACNANNKVVRSLGNHLTQPTESKMPINGLFDGTNSWVKTAPFTWTMAGVEGIYMMARLKSWTTGKGIFDGGANNSGILLQRTERPKASLYAGVFAGDNAGWGINEWRVVSAIFNGAASSLQFDDKAAVVGNSGTANMGGFTLGANGIVNAPANIEVKEVILRKGVETADNLKIIKGYLNSKKPIDNTVVGSLSKGFLVICFDDNMLGTHGFYTNGFPLFQAKGIKGNVYMPSDWVTTEPGWVAMRAMQSAGWDICNHTKTHTYSDTQTPEEIETEITDSQAALVANGLTAPTHFGYPGGTYSLTEDRLNVIKANFAGARRYGDTSYIYTNSSKYNLPSFALSNTAPYYALQYLDECKTTRTGIVLTTHSVFTAGNGGTGGIDVDKLEVIVNHAQSIGLEIITIKELYQLLG